MNKIMHFDNTDQSFLGFCTSIASYSLGIVIPAINWNEAHTVLNMILQDLAFVVSITAGIFAIRKAILTRKIKK